MCGQWYHFQSFQATTRIFSKKVQLGVNWLHIEIVLEH